jgi:urease accessory protein
VKTLGLVVFAMLATAQTASAHAVFGVTGFNGGLLHSVVVPSHLMALAALALLIGQQGWVRSVPVVAIVAVVVGLGAIALAYVPAAAEEALLALAAIAGLLVALARKLPKILGWLLAAAMGLALALDSPPEGISLREANLALLGTGLGAALVLAALVWLASLLRRDWQRIGARILGSWVAASAILVLALRVAA